MSRGEDQPSGLTKRPLGILRGIFAAIGVIIMVPTGGCAVLIIGSGGLNSDDLKMVGLLSGFPFLVGLGIFLLATRAGR